MAYDVFIRPLNTDKSKNQNIGGWFSCFHQSYYPNKFRQVLSCGDYDYYGEFSKAELLETGKDFATCWELPDTLAEYEHMVAHDEIMKHWMSERHYELLDMLQPYEAEAMFHIDAIFWESGMN